MRRSGCSQIVVIAGISSQNPTRLFFVQLYRWFPSVLNTITIIRPETLVRWHRAGRLAQGDHVVDASASSRLFDLNGETKRVRKRQSSAIIAADVRRFSYLINTDKVFGTHTGCKMALVLAN
jgi:hypothetical protein